MMYSYVQMYLYNDAWLPFTILSDLQGKTVSLSAFYRVARNTASLLFKQSDPKPELVEDEYWKVG